MKVSKCCGAVMVNHGWCPACDRPCDSVEEKKENIRKCVVYEKEIDNENIYNK